MHASEKRTISKETEPTWEVQPSGRWALAPLPRSFARALLSCGPFACSAFVRGRLDRASRDLSGFRIVREQAPNPEDPKHGEYDTSDVLEQAFIPTFFH